MQDFFERFARGRTLKTPTIVSSTFAKQMIQLLEMEGCLIDNDNISMIVLKQKIKEGCLSVSLFNQMMRTDC